MKAKKMTFIPSVDTKFTPAPTHIFSLEFAKNNIIGKKVLDVGCWNGDFETLLKNFKTNLTGLDPDQNALSVAKKRNPKFSFIKGDVHRSLPFKNNEFDTVLLWMTLEHLDNEKKALRNINKILKPKGYLIISTPSNNPLSIFFDLPYFLFGHKHFDPKTLDRYLKETGFKVKELYVLGSFFVALRISLLLFFKYLLRRPLPPINFIDKRQLAEYRSKKGFNEIFLKAVKVSNS